MPPANLPSIELRRNAGCYLSSTHNLYKVNNICRCHDFKFAGNDINSHLGTIRSAIHQQDHGSFL